MRKMLFVAGTGAVLAVVVWFLFVRDGKPAGEIAAVEQGPVYEEILATGSVKPAEELRFAFERGGIVVAVHAREGQSVAQGALVAELDSGELTNQAQAARAALAAQLAQLQEAERGSRAEDVRVAQTKLESAEDALEKQTQRAYVRAEGAIFSRTDTVFTNPTGSPSFGVSLTSGGITYYLDTPYGDLRTRLNTERAALSGMFPEWKRTLDGKAQNTEELAELSLDNAHRVRAFLSDLSLVMSSLNAEGLEIRSVAEGYRTLVAVAQTEVNAAIAELSSAFQQWRVASTEFDLVTAGSTEEQLAIRRSLADEARAQLAVLEAQLAKTQLRAPAAGRLVRQEAKRGEVVQMGQTVFTFFPEHELQIEVPVYEGDIVNIESGDTAIVSLVAFPDKQLEASVLNVDYAATLVDGAVHYKVTLALAEVPEGVRPDMTADVRFSVVYKEQALLIPERAVERRESRTYVQVARNGGFGEREVLVGQRSEGRMIEVIEGLELGERVLVR